MIAGAHDVKKNFTFGPQSFVDLDRIYTIVESKHAEALSEYKEATQKLELQRADVHRDEGAHKLVDTLKGQLKDAKAAFGKLEDSTDAKDAVTKEQLIHTVDRLSQ